MLNKPDWFILRMTSFCLAETSHLVHLEVSFSLLWPKPVMHQRNILFWGTFHGKTFVFCEVSWYINRVIIQIPLHHLIPALCYDTTTVFFCQGNSYFIRPAVLLLIREYEDSHFYDGLSVLRCIFSQFMVNVRTGFPLRIYLSVMIKELLSMRLSY